MKTKQLKLLIITLLVTILMTACSTTYPINNDDPDIPPVVPVKASFQGVVENVKEDFILIRTNEDFGDLVSVSAKDVKYEDFKIGDEVVVNYSGDVKESYPVQINATSIRLLDEIKQNKNDLITALNDFAYTSSQEILKEETHYAPLSTYTILSIIREGTDGKTKEELDNLLKDNKEISEDYIEYLNTLQYDKDNSKLLIADSLWLDKGFNGLKADINEDFMSRLDNIYNAEVFTVNFGNKKANKEIRKWIAENTNNLIDKEVKTKDGQLLSIIDTIYFKDNWETPFVKAFTEKKDFIKDDGSKVELDFMSHTTSANYIATDKWERAKLPFENGGEMIFLIPKKDKTLDELIKTDLKIAMEHKNLQEKEVKFSIPKFELESKMNLVTSLNKLGVNQIFEKNADFSRLTPAGNIYIDDLSQESKIIINEGGVESTAVTEVSIDTTSLKEIVNFDLNKPFVYGITNKDGVLLFLGRYNGTSK